MAPGRQTLSLDGAWEFVGLPADPTQRDHPHLPAWADESWQAGQVPGTVQADLLRLGLIPDPFRDTNAQGLRWIEDRDWWYRRTFALPPGFAADRVELHCAGLDTYASVWINGALVGRHANQFIPVEFDVSRYLRPGENEIVLLFRSTAVELADKDVSTIWRGVGEKQVAWARKCQCSFGWDWAPRIVTFGAWRPVTLEPYRAAALRDLFVRTRLDGSAATVEVAGDVERFGDRSLAVELDITTLPAGEIAASHSATVEGDGHRGRFAATFRLEQPRLWWPNGVGEPALYRCAARLVAAEGVVDERATRFGVREIGLRQDPIPSGKTFTLTVNGEPVFCKGANWGPCEALTVRATEEKYRAVLELARDANFTMLRVWGGGIYEDPAFYDLCDELGILLWHDFMYACSAYPDHDNGFRAEAEREAWVAVRRLRNHPSIALWCGNNENQWIHRQYVLRGEAPTPELPGRTIYHEILPRVCAELDPTRPYWPGSPWGGEQPNSMTEGNRHAYQVALGISDDGVHDFSWEAMDYRNYLEDTGKFISEFAAFPAIPEPEALERYLSPSGMSTVSPAWRYHVPHIEGWPAHFQDLLDFYATNTFGIPRDNAIGLEAWMRYARLVQGEALGFGVEHFRRAKFRCSGTLFWFYTSIWPSSDWSIVDYFAHPKPGYSFVRRAYAPVLVSFLQLPDNGYQVWGVNDRRHDVRASLRLRHGDFAGGIRWEATYPITIPANASVCLKTVSGTEMLVVAPRQEYVAAELAADGRTLGRYHLFLTDLRTLQFPSARLGAEIRERESARARVAVTTDVFARTVRLGLYGARCDDNYFHLLPGEIREVAIDLRRAEGRTLDVNALNAREPLTLEL